MSYASRVPITQGEPGQCTRPLGSSPDGTLVVGFDLDMTLIDSRAGVHATIVALIEETGVAIDPDVVVSRLGPPLEQELAEWVPADQIDPLADRYRELYAELGLVGSIALPGAAEAFDAVRAAGGESRRDREVRAERVALPRPRLPRGRRRRRLAARPAEGRDAPRTRRDDLRRRHPAGHRRRPPRRCVAVGVPTGPFTAAELDAAGADVVLDSLARVPRLVSGRILSSSDGPRPETSRADGSAAAGPELAGDQHDDRDETDTDAARSASRSGSVAVSLELVCIDDGLAGRTGNASGEACGRSAITRSRNAAWVSTTSR